MPRLPRLRNGVPAAPQAPEASTAEPETSGEPAAAATEEPRADAAPATSGDPLGVTPPTGETGGDGEAPPATTSGDPLGATAAAPAGDAPAEQATAVAPAAGETVVEAAPADAAPGFRSRARIRRRLRYLRRYRELAFRDLGGLVFDLHRFGRERPDLVAQKLGGLATVDRELRALETALRDRQDVTQLREAGIAGCPRCQTLHDTDANFCPGCGTALRGAVVRDAAPVTVTPAEPGAPS